ncbi:MAG TPA: hypothetical protein EYQ86_06810 [Bacteroidetes bacterium]|nr:hypothetical protein [Bacteroidota bacterium]
MYGAGKKILFGASINDLYTIFSNKGANSLLNDESLEVVIMCFAEGVDSYRKVYDHNLAQIAAQLQIVKQTLAAHYSSGSIEIIKHLSSALRENIRSAFPQDQLIINVNVKSQSAFILSPATAQAVGVEVSMTDNFVIKPHFTTSAESGANIIKIKVV